MEALSIEDRPLERQTPGSMPQIACKYDGYLRQLAALCWHLQGQWGDRPFPLGCRKAAEHLGVSPVHAWRLLNALHFDGTIHLVTKGSKAKGKANEWQFISQGD